MRDTDSMTTDDHQEPMLKSLADLRRARSMTLRDVADRMGVNTRRVSQIEARFPNLNYDTVARYLTALEGRIEFVVGTDHINAAHVIPDPDKAGTRAYLANRPGMGNLVYVPSRAAEELPLEQGETGTGGDDTGREVDQPDPESDQSDREDGQQP